MRGNGEAIWWAALLAGGSYMLAVVTGWTGPAVIGWKGAGVALLALWAVYHALRAPHVSRTSLWLLAAVMAFGALGDVVIDAVGLEAGGATFAAGHLIAILLYARHRRERLTSSQRALALLLVPLAAVIAWSMVRGLPGAGGAVGYTALVAAMAAMAWTSTFSRYRTGVGAMMFLVSDLLIFAREGGAMPALAATLLIWPLYFGGQALIARGVVDRLRAA